MNDEPKPIDPSRLEDSHTVLKSLLWSCRRYWWPSLQPSITASWVLAIWLGGAGWVQGQIAVVANLTSQSLQVQSTIQQSTADNGTAQKGTARETSAGATPGSQDGSRSEAAFQYRLAPGDVIAVWVGRGARLRLALDQSPRGPSPHTNSYDVRPGGAYFVSAEPDGPVLREIELGDVPAAAYPGLAQVAEVTVKLLVDDDEPTRERYWKKVLTGRVAEASRILERTCRVRLKVVGYEVWTSPADTTGLTDGMLAFEQSVDPAPARIAIGFASQYGPADAEHPHMGVVRGELGQHILLRERGGRLTEPEKLELLVHELGHYFGAVHIAHERSVMRPRLADGRARVRGFRIAFDPLNALIMNHHVTEWQQGRLPGEFRPEVVDRLNRLRQAIRDVSREVVASDDEVLPRLPKARPSEEGSPVTEQRQSTGLAADEDRLWEAVGTVLQSFHAPPPSRTSGDAVTDFYVHRAARAAQPLPADLAPRAFLVAVGIGLDDQDFLSKIPALRSRIRTLELPEQRARRRRFVAQATLSGRHDWALHFFVSALLAARYGEAAAGVAGVLKEIADARGGSGFDPADLAADRAGVEWAARILRRERLLLEVAEQFRAGGIRIE